MIFSLNGSTENSWISSDMGILTEVVYLLQKLANGWMNFKL